MYILITMLLSIGLVLLMGPVTIPMLQKLKFGQTIREDGPQTHLSKNGTPTMGGVMIVLSILISTLIMGKIDINLFIAIVSMFGFGIVGFLDDYIKVVKKRSLGLRAVEKIGLQIFLALFIPTIQVIFLPSMTNLMIPFSVYTLNLGFLYIPFMAFVILGTVNAVNLTDGLDGLSSSITVIVSLFFAIVGIASKDSNLTIFSISVMGACIGFLFFNKYPAKIFMGDTGSMALGGAVVAMATLSNNTLLIPIIGGIYFAEALSVIIQVASFKLRGKRVFKMAPLHHHFEQCGWKETKVVTCFSAVSLILFLASLCSLLICI